MLQTQHLLQYDEVAQWFPTVVPRKLYVPQPDSAKNSIL